MEAIGWISGACLATCAIPQAWKAYLTGDVSSLSWGFLLLWAVGEVTGVVYAIHLDSWPLLWNYVINGICLVVIIREKWNGKV